MNEILRTPRARWWAAAGFMALLGLIWGSYSLLEPMGRDQGIHGAIALGMDNGLTLYRDIYNIKPPLTASMHWVALKLFGHNMMAIRVLDLLAVVGVLWALLAITTGLGRRIRDGMLVGLSFLLIYYAQDFWNKAQTDGWGIFCILFATVALVRGWNLPMRNRRRLWMLLAGMLMGAAFAFKYTLGTFGLLVFAPLLAPNDQRRFYMPDLLFLCLGGMITLAVIGGVLFANGALEPYFEIQGYILSYLGYENPRVPLLVESLRVLLINPAATLAALAGLAALIIAYFSGRARVFHALIPLALVAGWISGFVQGKGFFYHYLPEIMSFSMLAGLGMATAYDAIAARTERGILAAGILASAFFIIQFPWSQQAWAISALASDSPRRTYWENTHKNWYNITEMADFADELAKIRKPDETMFLWGYETVVYLLADEPPRYRHPYAWALVVDFHDGRYTPDLMGRLQENPPVNFIVGHHDETPHVTGHDRDSAQSLPLIPELQAFVTDNYTQVYDSEYFDVWRLNAADAAATN